MSQVTVVATKTPKNPVNEIHQSNLSGKSLKDDAKLSMEGTYSNGS